MFICVCNALREKEMSAAIEQGAGCALDIYKSLGCAPKCGRCVPYVEQHLLSKPAAMASLCNQAG